MRGNHQVALFFFMSFVNTVIDSMKDSLVITAVGGGTEVIPFLTGAINACRRLSLHCAFV